MEILIEEFESVCESKRSFLNLYIYLMSKLKQTNDKKILFTFMIWCSQFKPL